MIQTTYTNARANFASLCDQVTENREIVVIHRRKGGSVAMIVAAELESLVATTHPLCSPANAERLLTALGRALQCEGEPATLTALRQEIGLAEQA